MSIEEEIPKDPKEVGRGVTDHNGEEEGDKTGKTTVGLQGDQTYLVPQFLPQFLRWEPRHQQQVRLLF